MTTSVLEKLYRYVDPRRAVEILTQSIKTTTSMEIDIRKACFYTIAEDIYSPIDRPWTNISHFDGFAVRSSDTVGASSNTPIELKLVGNVDSRNAHLYALREKETVFVETGYPLPVNADAVIPVEAVKRHGDRILVYSSIDPGFHVISMGGDVSKGELILKKGAIITPAIQNLLVSLGISRVLVYRPPKTVIIAVGSELTDEVITPSTTRMPASSVYMVENTIKYYGGVIVEKTIIGDDGREIIEAVYNVLDRADLIITIGGVSLGPKDLTWTSIYREFKPRYYVRGVKIHPGRATSGFNINGKVIVNLPGLPQSTFTGLFTIVLPILNYMLGRGRKLKLPFIKARSKRRYLIREYPSFYRLRFAIIDNGKVDLIVDGNSSYFIKPIALSDGFTLIPPNKTVIEENEELEVYTPQPFYYTCMKPLY